MIWLEASSKTIDAMLWMYFPSSQCISHPAISLSRKSLMFHYRQLYLMDDASCGSSSAQNQKLITWKLCDTELLLERIGKRWTILQVNREIFLEELHEIMKLKSYSCWNLKCLKSTVQIYSFRQCWPFHVENIINQNISEEIRKEKKSKIYHNDENYFMHCSHQPDLTLASYLYLTGLAHVYWYGLCCARWCIYIARTYRVTSVHILCATCIAQWRI